MEAEAMAALGWSSLPADIVNRVADSLLATNDLDCYTALRAVCHHWRSVTADPASNPHDPRFRPTQWIMLDEDKSSFSSSSDADDDTRLFVNTSTGRFHRKSLPFHRGYYLVTSTVGGFVILAGRQPPHAARVLNPFTGCMIRFKAPVPSELYMTANVVAVGDLLVLVLAPSCQSGRPKFYLADPDSEHFSLSTEAPSYMDLVRSPLLLVPSLGVEVAPGEILPVSRYERRRVQSRYQRRRVQSVRLFRMNSTKTGIVVGERVTNFGSRALFVGDYRCFSVNAASFPSIEANCVYHHVRSSSSPVPIVQLLAEYTECPQGLGYEPAFTDVLNNAVTQLFSWI